MNQLEEEVRFSQLLADYWMTRGGHSILKRQSVKEVEMNPFKLYKSVCKRGGAKAVTNSNSWKDVVEEAVSSDVVSEENTVKKYYIKTIYPYERKVYFGYEETNDQHDIISSKNKVKNMGESQKDPSKTLMNIQTKSSTYAREQEQQNNFNLLQELQKFYEKEQKEQQLYYLKKTRIQPNLQELRRIQIGLISNIPSQIIYSLNMLLIYSTNTNNNLLFDQFNAIIKSLQQYISQIYPIKIDHHLQYLKTLTLIIRNFCISTSYLQLILKTQLFTTLVDIYNKNVDKECSKNIVEIMTGLVKVGWDCRTIISQITDGIVNENNQDIQIGVDMIRGLVDEREETLEEIVIQNLDVFAKLFVSSTPQIKQTVLQIFAYISDLSSNSRTTLAKHPYILQKLIQILGSQTQQFEKLCDLSALTISNISAAPGSKEFIKHFQKELVIIACSDERIGNIVAGILAELENS